TVEMDRFASLRPPTYGGAMVAGQMGNGQVGGVGGIAGFGGGGINPGFFPPANGLVVPGNRYQNGVNLGQLGLQGGQVGLQGGTNNTLMQQTPNVNNDGTANTFNFTQNNRLTYQELQQRRQQMKEDKEKAKRVGSAIAALDPAGSVQSLASADEIG